MLNGEKHKPARQQSSYQEWWRAPFKSALSHPNQASELFLGGASLSVIDHFAMKCSLTRKSLLYSILDPSKCWDHFSLSMVPCQQDFLPYRNKGITDVIACILPHRCFPKSWKTVGFEKQKICCQNISIKYIYMFFKYHFMLLNVSIYNKSQSNHSQVK